MPGFESDPIKNLRDINSPAQQICVLNNSNKLAFLNDFSGQKESVKDLMQDKNADDVEIKSKKKIKKSRRKVHKLRKNSNNSADKNFQKMDITNKVIKR